MGIWAVAAVTTLIFLSLFNSEDFCTRMNFRVAPSFTYQLTVVGVMFANFVFCYVWEVITDLLLLLLLLKRRLFCPTDTEKKTSTSEIRLIVCKT
jgi:hypothetical protein